MKVLENWVLKKILGPKRGGGVIGSLRKQHNEEVCDL
jgi:hypothetical protein